MSLTDPAVLLVVAGLLAAGVAAGLIAGLLGVGGGIVIVPVLVTTFAILEVAETTAMHLAIGTSLATIMITAIASTRGHHAKGAVDFAILKTWAPGMLVGVLAGTLLGNSLSGAKLTVIFASLALVVAAQMAFGRRDATLVNGLPSAGWQRVMGSSVGFVSALMGVGGGVIAVPLMCAFGVPVHRAVGTSAAFGLVVAVPGALGYLLGGWNATDLPVGSLGYVNVIAWAIIVPVTWFAAPWGAKLAHVVPQTLLRRLFAAFLAITAVRMVWFM